MPAALAVSAILLALAQDTVAIRISYDAPSSCPNAQALYDSVRARTARVRPAANDESALEVSVRVSHTERGFSGEVRETVDHNESAARTVEGGTCKEVVEALSLTIALSVDPEAHAPRPASARPLPAPAAACPPAPEPPPSVAAETAPPVRLELGLGVLATEVVSSDLSGGGALWGTFLRKTGENLSASLELSLLFATTGLGATPDTHQARFGAFALDACPVRWELGQLELAPCALASVGFLEVTGRGVPTPATVDRAWWSAGLDLQLSVLLGQGFVFESAAGAALPLVQRRFYLDEPGNVVAKTPAISPLMRLGLGYRF